MGACSSAANKDEAGAGPDNTLVGQPDDSQSAPLLSKIAKDNLPEGKLKDFDLKFDATEEQQAAADIVLAFPLEDASAEQPDGVAVDPLAVQRRDLLMRLARAGLQYCSMKSADGDEAFIIIQATEERLMECAEFSGHELRLKKSWQVPYAKFTVNRKDDFIWENREQGKIFSTRDRQTLIMRILETGDHDSVDGMHVTAHENSLWQAKYGQNKLPTCGLNLDKYKSDGVITGYWAMHGHARRNKLIQEWAFTMFRPQPLQLIYQYFNSKTAIYFAFAGYYSAWLLLSSVLGIACMVYEYTGAANRDDNIMVAGYAFFMALWGTLFIEFWKRYNAELAYRWSTFGLQEESHERNEFRKGTHGVTRQGFYSAGGQFVPYDDELDGVPGWCSCGMFQTDKVEEDVDEHTQKTIVQYAPPDVPYMDQQTRFNRMMLNAAVAMVFIGSVLAVLMAFLVMRLVFQATLDAKYGATIASTLQAAVTVGLNVVYKEIAICMVDYENHRTDAEWEDAIINKVFLFQFINSYFTLFYIAFLKGKIGDLYGYNDQCIDASTGEAAESCMGELSNLLLSTLLTTQILSTVAEAALPYAQYKLLIWAEHAKWKASGQEGEMVMSDIDHESKLTPAWALDTFTDYNKMAIQFGYVSMFVAAFPLAPLCAFINNRLEIRTDAWKRLLGMQRPTPSERAENIGAWIHVLECMSIAAVATNMGVLCFTSNTLANKFKLNDTQRVWAFVILEHAVIMIKLMLAFVIPDVPEWVTLRMARDEYMLQSREDMIEREEEARRGEGLKGVDSQGITMITEGVKGAMRSQVVTH